MKYRKAANLASVVLVILLVALTVNKYVFWDEAGSKFIGEIEKRMTNSPILLSDLTSENWETVCLFPSDSIPEAPMKRANLYIQENNLLGEENIQEFPAYFLFHKGSRVSIVNLPKNSIEFLGKDYFFSGGDLNPQHRLKKCVPFEGAVLEISEGSKEGEIKLGSKL